ncbi:MAG TPA: M23 family metallopeptidase [Candidatus Dormibacteraeota bacterium]
MAAPAVGAAARALARQALLRAAARSRSRDRHTFGCGCAAAAAVAIALALVALVAALVASAIPIDALGTDVATSGSGSDAVVPLECPDLQVSQGFGDTPFEHPHTGIDLVCPAGTPVRAVAAGTFHAQDGGAVPCSFPIGAHGGLGHFGEIDAGDVEYLYGHLEGFAAADGASVQAGTVIGFEGMSGCSTGFHLHFEVRVGAKAINPCSFLPQDYPAAHESAGNRCWGSAPP